MAQVPDKISALIDDFIAELNSNNIRIDRAILFGSFATGTYTKWSDIDLAIVSPDFAGDRFADRDKIRRIKLKLSSSLEPVPYSPETFSTDDPFVKNIIATGVTITPKNTQ